MRIAIVDDERPARRELVHQIKELAADAVITEGDSGAAALKIAGEGRYDLFFLDINLGDIAGTAFLEKPQKEFISGSTGAGVRTLLNYVKNI